MRGTSLVAMSRFRRLAEFELQKHPELHGLYVARKAWQKYLDAMALAELRYALILTKPGAKKLNPPNPNSERKIDVVQPF